MQIYSSALLEKSSMLGHRQIIYQVMYNAGMKIKVKKKTEKNYITKARERSDRAGGRGVSPLPR